MKSRSIVLLLAVLAALFLTACGGGGSSGVRVRIAVLAATGLEGGGPARLLVSRSGERREPCAVACAVSGTASNEAGVDFAEAPFPNPIVFPADVLSVEILLTPVDDALPEGSETVTVTLLRAQGLYDVGPDFTATVTILDDDPLVENVTVAEAKALVDGHAGDPDFGILDVRTPAEFAAGHIAGAVNVDFLAGDFGARLEALDPAKAWLLHCKSGARSTGALPALAGLGFLTVYHMTAGFDGWVAAGYPVSTD